MNTHAPAPKNGLCATNASRGLRTAVVAAILVACAAVFDIHAEEPKRDWDIRCCLDEQDLEDVFVIELAGIGRPVGHLSVISPTGTLVGFDASSQTFSHTSVEEGLYALGPRPQPSIDAPLWNHDRFLLLYRHAPVNGTGPDGKEKVYQMLDAKRPVPAPLRLDQGRYRVRVVGLWGGRYTLRFYSLGRQQGAAAEFGANGGLAIKPGEIHEYSFDGQRVQVMGAGTKGALQPLDLKRIR